MNDRSDEIDMHVENGMAKPRHHNAARSLQRSSFGAWGCLLLPLLLTTLLLVAGISQLLHWPALTPLGQLGAIVKTVLGGAGLLIVVAVYLILRAVGKTLRQMRRDAQQTMQAVKYVANMPNTYGNRLPDDPAPPAP